MTYGSNCDRKRVNQRKMVVLDNEKCFINMDKIG